MKKMKFLSMMMLASMTLSMMVSCSKDDDDSGINVVIDENGQTSNGSTFYTIDNQSFYLDNIQYTVNGEHLMVSGYDKIRFNGEAKIVDRITYKGNTYEVREIGERAVIVVA